jgi:hypothetical protein
MPGPNEEMPGKKDMPGAERELPRTDVEPTKKPYYEGYFGAEEEGKVTEKGAQEGERKPTEEQEEKSVERQMEQDSPPPGTVRREPI